MSGAVTNIWSVVTVTLISSASGAFRADQSIGLAYGRHFHGGSHHHHGNPLQSDRAPGGDFSLDAGVSSVLQQLEAVCRESQQFRALNLDISCPAHLPHLTSCACVVKSRAGEVVRRENGTAGYTGCGCGRSRQQSSASQHVITRSSCCSKEDRRGGSLAPDVAATTAEQNSQVVLCPAEAPHKTKYRSSRGLVTCGQRMVGKCLCLDPDQPQRSRERRQVGTVEGNQCHCKKKKRSYNSSASLVVRAVCCSTDPGQENGETVFTQN